MFEYDELYNVYNIDPKRIYGRYKGIEIYVGKSDMVLSDWRENKLFVIYDDYKETRGYPLVRLTAGILFLHSWVSKDGSVTDAAQVNIYHPVRATTRPAATSSTLGTKDDGDEYDVMLDIDRLLERATNTNWDMILSGLE